MAKILVVDDDTQTTALIESLIKMSGHEPTSVNQSWNAVATAKSTVPDLILLDIMMADINGIDLCKMFKADPELKKIPVIMVSALDDDGSKKDSYNAGAKDYITKPFLSKEFTRKINAVLSETA
ncbi:MAG: response regulator [Anaerolineales bacterium]